MRKNENRYKSGFTLVELIVVMAILSIVGVFTIASITTLLVNNRDGKRKADLQLISDALEHYRSNNTDDAFVYPFPDSNRVSDSNVVSNIDDLDEFLKTIPSDPVSGNNCPGYLYVTTSDTKDYTLYAQLESTTAQDVTGKKPTPKVLPNADNSGDIFITMNNSATSTCGDGVTKYNYWINSP